MKTIFYLVFYFYLRECGAYRQEFARIVYYNPKYVLNPKAMTARISRKEPYRTNVTATTLHPWGNNVTITYNIAGIGTDFKLKNKVCNIIKYNWIVEFFKSSSFNITCPMPAKLYSIYNIEFPPKNFDLPLPRGDTSFALVLYLTDTMESLLEFSVRLNIH